MVDVIQDKPNDDFEAAFAQISEADKKGETVKPEDIKAAPVVEKTAEQIEAERVAAEAAAAVKTPEQIEAERVAAETAATAAKTPEQIAAEAAAAAEAAKAADQDLVSRLSTLIKGADPAAAAREATAAAERARVAQEAEAATERARTAQTAPQLSAEELALVQQFEKDFPDVARAQAIVRRAEYKQVVGYVFDEVEKAFNARVAPIAQLVQNLAERTHVGDLKTAVPDYDKLDVAKLKEWVGKQPAYLQPAYDMVMRQGTAEDVKDLVTRFHAETGVKQVQTAPDPKVVAAAAAAEAAKKKAIAALAPVTSSRSGVAVAGAPSDFDGAFAEFSKEMAAQEASDRFTR